MRKVKVTKEIEKRFKILSLLCLQLNVLEEQMSLLALNLDEGTQESLDALSFFEDKIIEILGEKEEDKSEPLNKTNSSCLLPFTQDQLNEYIEGTYSHVNEHPKVLMEMVAEWVKKKFIKNSN